ncbi:MAG: hypothetical protein IPI67_24275 [Myxococcales bacterium]|nr:hypothetical protein [Myxococcales bacterium]
MRLVRSKMFPLVVGYLMAAGIAQAQPVPADDEGEEIKPIDEPDDKKSDDKKIRRQEGRRQEGRRQEGEAAEAVQGCTSRSG